MSATTLHGAPALFEPGITQVARDAWAFLQPNGGWSESNVGLVAGDGAALLVDTTWDLRTTERVLREVAAATEEPLRTLVVTHADGDHVNGCQLLPGARMIASAAAVAELREERPRQLQLSKLGAELLARAGVGPVRHYGRYLAEMFGPFDFRGVRIRMPDQTFADRLDLEVGGREVEVLHLGPAHTQGDAIVHVPDARLVYAGDVLFAGVTPNAWAGPITAWRRALARLGELSPELIVPGHGPVSDLDAVDELDRYWGWLEREAGRLLAAGHDVDETSARLVLGDAFAAEPWSGWELVERTVMNVVLVDRERRGVSTHITHGERAGLLWKVARLDARIRAARA